MFPRVWQRQTKREGDRKMSKIDNLLEQVNLIAEKYEGIAKATGEDFNVFEILHIESDELKHSRILSEILSPSGEHNCDDVFLKLFLEKFLPNTAASRSDFSKCQVHREYYAKDFGRIDIFIDCSDFGIAIENKIYAGDQPEQLKRYDEFLKGRYKEKSYLFYLTLNGDKSSEYSSGDAEYKCLSYRDDILLWLKLCQKEACNKPIIRETLEQYINLIKILTNQTRSEKMSKDIVETITGSAENMKSALEIGKNLPKAKEKIFNEKLREPLIKIIESKYENLRHESGHKDSFDEKEVTIAFKKDDWGFSIRIIFSEKFSKISYGAIGNVNSIREQFEKSGFIYKDFMKIFGVCNLLKDEEMRESIFVELCKPDNDILESSENKIKEILSLIE
jgi:hypothetical protein